MPAKTKRPDQSKNSSPSTILSGYIGQLAVVPPFSHGGLCLYPLVAATTADPAPILTLDEAIDSGQFAVSEVSEGGTVNTLVVENRGHVAVFIMAGEILRGAKQDRTLQSDMLVPAASGRLTISVFCTERGRWARVSHTFAKSDYHVPSSVRAAYKRRSDQGTVWSSISESYQRLQAPSRTDAAREMYEAPVVQQDIRSFEEALGSLPGLQPQAIGVLAAHGNRIIALDVFGDAEVFRKLYPKLLKSYAVEVLDRPAPPAELSAESIARLLEKAGSSPWAASRSEGLGHSLILDSSDLHGSALVADQRVLHSDLFAPALA